MMMAIIDDIRQEENVNNNQRETMEAIDGDNWHYRSYREIKRTVRGDDELIVENSNKQIKSIARLEQGSQLITIRVWNKFLLHTREIQGCWPKSLIRRHHFL